jgi:PKD repeat protein
MEPIEGWQRAYFASGNNNETMQRVSWDVSKWAGRTGQIRIVDDSSGPWGHINVDDFVFSSRRRDPIPPPAQQLEFSSDRTTVNPGEQVTFFLTPASAAAGFVYDISFSGEPSEVMEGAQAVHEYRKPGDYTVTVTPRPSAERPSPVIVDNFLKIRVQSVPLTHAPEPVYAGESVTFTIGSDDSSMRYRFHFEEGPPGEWSTAPQAKHTYENPGMYTVSASMSREGWAEPISTESTTVTVMQRPSTEVAGRTPDPATDTDPQVWPFILVGMAVAGVTGYKWFLSRRPMLIPVPDRVDSQLRRAPRIDLRIVASPGVESGNHTVKRLKILRISSLRRKNG